MEECIGKIVKAANGAYTPEQARALLVNIQKKADDKGISIQELLQSQTMVLEDIKQASVLRKQQKLEMALKRVEFIRGRGGVGGLDLSSPKAAIKSIQRKFDNISKRVAVLTSQNVSQLKQYLRAEGEEVLEHFNLKKDPELVAQYIGEFTKRARINEVKGSVDFQVDLKMAPPEHRLAAKVAKQIVRQRTEKFIMYKALGADIRFLEGRIAKNFFDPIAFARNKDESMKALLDFIDWDKTHVAGLSREEFVSRLVETIKTGKTLDVTEGIEQLYDSIVKTDVLGAAEFNLAKKLGKSRMVHIKADRWHEFNVKWGVGDIYEAIRKEQQADARHMTLLDAFGSNPEDNWNATRKLIADESPGLISGQKHIVDIEKIEALFPHLAGYVDRPDNFMRARVFQSLRKLTQTTKLGMSVVTALSDLTNPAVRKALYIASDDLGDQVGKYLSGTADNFKMAVGIYGSDTAKAMFKGTLEELHELQGSVYSQMKLADVAEAFDLKTSSSMVDKFLNASDRFNDWIFQGNLLQGWTDRGMARAYVSFSKELGTMASKSLQELPDNFRQALKELDIEDLWDVARKKAFKDPMVKGDFFLAPNALDDLTDAELTSIFKDMRGRNLKAERASISQRWRAAFALEADLRISNPILSKQAATIGLSRRGTWWGEFRRSAMQFKMFPIMQMTETILPALQRNRGGAIGAWFAISIPIQMQIMTIRNLVSGLTPPDFGPNEAGLQNWAVLMTRIAGFPFFDDFVIKSMAAMTGKEMFPADEFMAGALGPLASDAGTVLAGSVNTLASLVQGKPEKAAKHMIKTAKVTPFIGPVLGGHLGAKAINNLLIDNLYQTFDPNYFDTKDRYAEMQGSHYYNFSDPNAFFEGVAASYQKE